MNSSGKRPRRITLYFAVIAISAFFGITTILSGHNSLSDKIAKPWSRPPTPIRPESSTPIIKPVVPKANTVPAPTRPEVSPRIIKPAILNENAIAPDHISDAKKEVSRAEIAPGIESFYIVFSTGCSEFQDWQSIGVFSSAESVGQRGQIVRIASGCTAAQETAISLAMMHLPDRCRVHFAPNTQIRDYRGQMYKYANKPLGLLHWLEHTTVSPFATIVLIDPDMFQLKPLWHDSFDSPSKYIVSGAAAKYPIPTRLKKGTMIAQQYGIGGAPWTRGAGRERPGKKPWGLKEYLSNEAGRPNSPALAQDLTAETAGTFFSIGAPYIALAADWLPIAANWTALMPMAVQRNFGNLAEMYALSIAVADLGIRPARVDNLMVSDIGAGGEGWPLVEKIPFDRACDPAILLDSRFELPTFLHYCHGYTIDQLEGSGGGTGAHWMFSKYQVPDEILHCPAGSKSSEGSPSKSSGKKRMELDAEGFLPEPPVDIKVKSKSEMRSVFSHCTATRATNHAARDFRRWFCNS